VGRRHDRAGEGQPPLRLSPPLPDPRGDRGAHRGKRGRRGAAGAEEPRGLAALAASAPPEPPPATVYRRDAVRNHLLIFAGTLFGTIFVIEEFGLMQ
jgi:hypothetical protein